MPTDTKGWGGIAGLSFLVLWLILSAWCGPGSDISMTFAGPVPGFWSRRAPPGPPT